MTEIPTTARAVAVQAVKDHPSTTFMAPYESLADAVLAETAPLIRFAAFRDAIAALRAVANPSSERGAGVRWAADHIGHMLTEEQRRVTPSLCVRAASTGEPCPDHSVELPLPACGKCGAGHGLTRTGHRSPLGTPLYACATGCKPPDEGHQGPDPSHGGLTAHRGTRENCSGPDCGPVEDDTPTGQKYPCGLGVYCDSCSTEFRGDFIVTDTMTTAERLEVVRSHVRTTLRWQCDASGDFCESCAKQRRAAAEPSCTDPRHTGPIRTQLGCNGPDPASTATEKDTPKDESTPASNPR
ncbi:hypothetical protein [Streptomyces sp. BE230]|uniref:hypothetical protein n=1 Tax=Streptomyces sp. BE230 TaxID=3002526 RepID=UPI002ED5D324|nr:hypothetical protein [Streptomyces sp. BE230]